MLQGVALLIAIKRARRAVRRRRVAEWRRFQTSSEVTDIGCNRMFVAKSVAPRRDSFQSFANELAGLTADSSPRGDRSVLSLHSS